MRITLVAYGIAKDILKSNKIIFELESGIRIKDLKSKLVIQYPEFEVLQSLRFAINEDYQNDDYQIRENEEVVIIPPVSGG